MQGKRVSLPVRHKERTWEKTLSEALLVSKASNPLSSRVLQDMGFEDDYEGKNTQDRRLLS